MDRCPKDEVGEAGNMSVDGRAPSVVLAMAQASSCCSCCKKGGDCRGQICTDPFGISVLCNEVAVRTHIMDRCPKDEVGEAGNMSVDGRAPSVVLAMVQASSCCSCCKKGGDCRG